MPNEDVKPVPVKVKKEGRYSPHQGEEEIQRRLRQIKRGFIRPTGEKPE